jgi:hypothetical protein
LKSFIYFGAQTNDSDDKNSYKLVVVILFPNSRRIGSAPLCHEIQQGFHFGGSLFFYPEGRSETALKIEI